MCFNPYMSVHTNIDACTSIVLGTCYNCSISVIYGLICKRKIEDWLSFCTIAVEIRHEIAQVRSANVALLTSYDNCSILIKTFAGVPVFLSFLCAHGEGPQFLPFGASLRALAS